MARKDALSFWARVGAIAAQDADGAPVYRAVTSDTTSRKKAEDALREQAGEPRARNDELSRFNRVAVDRTLRMIELKREVSDLRGKIGEPPRHRPAGGETAPATSTKAHE
ncbi:MAG: hypothetical protein WCP22_00690 [Chlamydiota bacterium]